MEVTEAISVFFLGAIIFAPVAALSARFAMKPIFSLLSRRLATEDLGAEVAAQRRRIEALENELADMHESLRTAMATAEFDRRLSEPTVPPKP
jgi:hypothetical protein